MFVMRLPVATWAAASSCEAGGAEDSSTGGMRAIREILWLAPCNPGAEFGGYRIEAVEREDAGAAVLLARDPRRTAPSRCTSRASRSARSSTVRFLERAHRLGAVAHPHLLGVYDARTLEGRAVAVAQAPPGRRLDELLAGGRLGAGRAVRIARQVASAVDALEEAGAEPPPLTAERIWVDGAGDAHLDGLDGAGIALPAASSSAAVAWLLADMAERVPRRARDRPCPRPRRRLPVRRPVRRRAARGRGGRRAAPPGARGRGRGAGGGAGRDGAVADVALADVLKG